MNEEEGRERLKQMSQVIINGKNAGKLPDAVAKLAGMDMKDFQQMAPKFKVIIRVKKSNLPRFRKYLE